jgi:Zn-dependent protease with chaperone function
VPSDPSLPFAGAAATWLWHVALHSFVAGLLLYAWARHLALPAGRTRRLLLAAVLVVPLVTAALGPDLTGAAPWFDSARLLALPVGLGLTVADLAAGAGALTAAVAIVQEILPSLQRPRRSGGAIPLWLGPAARSLPGWERCTLQLVAGRQGFVATGGHPGRPHLLLSPDVLDLLPRDELEAVLRHENAHHAPRRWWALHLLFAVRLLQLPNPVALWVFRGYTLDLEVACDADAVTGRDPRPLARALLAVYDRTDRRDVASREALRRRVDVLLGRAPVVDRALPAESVAAAVALLLLLLPWIV